MPAASTFTLLEKYNKEKLTKQLSSQTNCTNVPSPFKINLFWPGTPTNTKRGAAKKQAVKITPVYTSKEWQDYEKRIQEKGKRKYG